MARQRPPETVLADRQGNDNFTQKSQQPAKYCPTGMTLERSIAGTRAMDRQDEGSEGSPCAMTLVDTGGVLP
ncbi:MAG: hypothetical protein IJ174_05185 [Clostridia bacterium]|nr:hypothetical protein [Clostridia bacterium]